MFVMSFAAPVLVMLVSYGKLILLYRTVNEGKEGVLPVNPKVYTIEDIKLCLAHISFVSDELRCCKNKLKKEI